MLLSRLDNRQFLWGFLGLAVALRLCLMPFFGHVDIFSEYRRVLYAIENGHILDNGHRILIYYIEIIFAWFGTWFINVNPALFHIADPTQSTANLDDYKYFLSDPHVYRYLFFFKLPYLLFDLATALLIWRYIDNPALKRVAILIWLFNPLTLFATYLFGRFEVISLFFLCLTAYQLKQHRLLLASVSFGLALWCREINLLFLPIFVIALFDRKEFWLKNTLVACACVGVIGFLYTLPGWLLPSIGGDMNLFLDPNTARSTDALHQLQVLGYYWFFPVVVGLLATIFYTWENLDKDHSERFVIGSALALLVYFAFNVHSVHYAAWLMLFPVMAIQYNAKVFTPLLALWITWTVLWLLTTDAGVFTPFLAAPLHDTFMDMGHFPTYFKTHLATAELTITLSIFLTRSAFATVMAYLAYRLVSRGAS